MLNIAIVEDDARQAAALEEYCKRFARENGAEFDITRCEDASAFSPGRPTSLTSF